MKTVRTPQVTMPAIGLGTWQLEDVVANVRHALDVGYRHIDTRGERQIDPPFAPAWDAA